MPKVEDLKIRIKIDDEPLYRDELKYLEVKYDEAVRNRDALLAIGIKNKIFALQQKRRERQWKRASKSYINAGAAPAEARIEALRKKFKTAGMSSTAAALSTRELISASAVNKSSEYLSQKEVDKRPATGPRGGPAPNVSVDVDVNKLRTLEDYFKTSEGREALVRMMIDTKNTDAIRKIAGDDIDNIPKSESRTRITKTDKDRAIDL